MGALLVVLDARVPTPFGRLDVLPDVLGWVVVLLVVRRQGWRRLVPPVAVLAVASLVDLVVPDVRAVVVAQAFTPLLSLLGLVLLAVAAQTYCLDAGDRDAARRFAGHRRRLPFVAVPTLVTAWFTVTGGRPGPLVPVAALAVLLGFGLLAWLVGDLLLTRPRRAVGAPGGTDAE